jgi:hypothetical protein
MRETSGFYEEEHAWSKLAVVFPQFFRHSEYRDSGIIKADMARQVFCDWYPDSFERFYGTTLKDWNSKSRIE